MTIRTDVSLDWNSSPRVLTVAAPSDEITVQEVVDTLRNYEDSPVGIGNDKLVAAAGKEFLGGTTYVGITATLQDCLIAFEARGGPSWVLCAISGGNVVAIDSLGGYIDPRQPTAYVSCDRTASASATLQEQEALQHSSFNGGVTVDLGSSYSGTAFPNGTPQQPVNNFIDALVIANENGFTTIYIIGSVTLDSGTDFEEMIFIGESMSKTTITIASDADVSNCEFYDAEIEGVLDGGNVLKNCLILDLNYVNGYIEQCVLGLGTITLGGGAEAHFLDCWSGVVGTGTPIVDMGGSGQDLGIRNYNGGLEVKNLTGTNKVNIDLNSGRIILDSTITAGNIVVRGIGELEDSSTGTATVDTDGLIGRDLVNDITYLRQIIDNKKSLVKTGSVWQLLIYDNDGIDPILVKDLKDKDGNNITDIAAGVLAQELKTSV